MTTPTAQQFLAAFRTYLGVTESPLGSNRTRVGVEFGWNGVPWCAETVSVALQRAGWGRTFWSASTDQWEAWARQGYRNSRWISRTERPRPGDLCIWDYAGDGTANHISAVETVRADGMLVTLGGNESNRCQRAVRSKSRLRGFIRLPFRVASTTTTSPTNQFGMWPTTIKPTIKRGAHGPVVGYLQSVINRKAGGNMVVDNDFGPKTEERVKDVQRFFKLTVDGVVGPRTWGIIDYLAKR